MNKRRIKRIWSTLKNEGKLCTEWGKSFDLFVSWSISNDYSETKEIKLINGRMHAPNNSMWVEKKRLEYTYKTEVEYLGEVATVKELSDKYGMHPSTIKNRLNRGWTVLEALEIKVGDTNYRLLGESRKRRIKEKRDIPSVNITSNEDIKDEVEIKDRLPGNKDIAEVKIKSAWRRMMYSCYDKGYVYYSSVGKRGIKVCEEWKKYKGFRNWCISVGFKPWKSLGRIDERLDFGPDNCYLYVSNYGIGKKRASYGIELTKENELTSLRAILVSTESLLGESMLVRNDIIALSQNSELFDSDSIKDLLYNAKGILDNVEELKVKLDSVRLKEV